MTDNISSATPFVVTIPDEEVQRMLRLVADTRLPASPPIPGASWDYGIDLDWLKMLRDAWLKDFSWRDVERDMNYYSQFTAVIESVTVHFIHQKSDRPDAVPIILLHGWPGSFWEYHRMVSLLTNPPVGQPAFHVVIPSLPGFGFSSPPPRKGWTNEDSARLFDHLMTGVLGYSTYMAMGGDIGGLICTFLGTDQHPACRLLNLTEVPAQPTLGALITLPFFLLPTNWWQTLYGMIYTADELRDFSRNSRFIKNGMGYFVEQATRPLSVGYALHDSPIGLLAWIGEKFKEHVDPSILPQCTRFILATVSLYYLTGTFMTSTLPYRENLALFGKRIVMTTPYGSSRFAYDLGHFPVGWAKKQHKKNVFLRRHDTGGHFPGYEVPELLASDLREMVSNNKSLFAC